jgi:hypothetical protein
MTSSDCWFWAIPFPILIASAWVLTTAVAFALYGPIIAGGYYVLIFSHFVVLYGSIECSDDHGLELSPGNWVDVLLCQAVLNFEIKFL